MKTGSRRRWLQEYYIGNVSATAEIVKQMVEIKPRVSVDGLPFGATTSSLAKLGYVEDVSGYDTITEWRTFRKNEEAEVYVKDDVVVCVACFLSCVIDGKELIGRTSSEVLPILGNPDEVGEAIWVSDDRQQIPHEYFSLGLQVWFESDKVVSVFSNANY